MPTIYRPDGSVKAITNLGWLLRNWRNVEMFIVKFPERDSFGAELHAHMNDQSEYVTDYADANDLWGWLDRPVFRDIPILWGSVKTTCGSKLFDAKTRDY